MDNHDEITKLAREHMQKCHTGKLKLSNNYKHKKHKEVRCNMCGKSMTVPDFENPPYYCYRHKDDIEELECALR